MPNCSVAISACDMKIMMRKEKWEKQIYSCDQLLMRFIKKTKIIRKWFAF